jgi:hypothetical protein
MRAEDEPPVCHTLMDLGSRLLQLEHRNRAPAGNGSCVTSRCALCPHLRHSMKIVAVDLGMARA